MMALSRSCTVLYCAILFGMSAKSFQKQQSVEGLAMMLSSLHCRRPGILVLVNDVDWELRYRVLLDALLWRLQAIFR